MRAQTVLISGAGIAGPTLAYWLARHGFRPTVVENARAMRSSGSPVDVRGPAVRVAEAMDAMPRIRGARTGNTGLSFVNAAGKRVGRMDMRATQREEDVEIPRGDLASILHEASRDHAEFLFGDSIAALDQDEHGVDVTFEHGAPRRFDLVIGADGLHSVTRRLTFGAESGFAQHMGLYVATIPIDDRTGSSDVTMHNTPGKAIAISPTPHGPIAFFLYRSPEVPDFDHRDIDQHKRLLTAAFADVGWHAPRLLEAVATTDDLYFDSVSRVRMPRWSKGRVALLGDAASCVSLFGDGSTLAMAGAFTLAEQLSTAPGDPQTAFQRYEAAHRRLVDPKQQNVKQAAAFLAPATRTAIVARNLLTRLSPIAAGATRLRRSFATRPDRLGKQAG